MKKEKAFRRKCELLARQIAYKADILITKICYREFLHNVYYENGICYCSDSSERRLTHSGIEKCRFKTRVQVTMIAAKKELTNRQRNLINKILHTNVQYKKLANGYTEISFRVSPHNM